jgi:hypothetical protein
MLDAIWSILLDTFQLVAHILIDIINKLLPVA